jgi:hypothetical protein
MSTKEFKRKLDALLVRLDSTMTLDRERQEAGEIFETLRGEKPLDMSSRARMQIM